MKHNFYENIYHKIKSKHIEIVSFDFFDTIMSRRVTYAKDIFYILGSRIKNKNLFSIEIAPERFQEIRVMAEEEARKCSPLKEISIENIYDKIPKEFFKCDKKEIINLEIATEKEFLFPVSEIKNLMEIAKSRGKKIIVTSDTYLDEDHLKYLWGNSAPNIEIKFFTSSKYKTGKYEKLFEYVSKETNTEYNKILHIGDNYISDIKTPSSMGIETCFMPHGSGILWEIVSKENHPDSGFQKRLNENFGDLGVSAFRCKAMHLSSMDSIDEISPTQYGAQILGPIISPFIHWISETAKSEKIDLIAPLMREGYLINKLLQYYPEIKSRPAYFSRRVLIQASLQKATKESLYSLRFNNLESSISDFLDLILLDTSDIPEFSEKAGFTIKKEDIFKELIEKIISSPSLKDKIEASAKTIRAGVIKHFIKTVSIDGKIPKRIALADVGWNGTIQKLLTKILEEEGIKTEIIGLYMMTTPAVNNLALEGIIAKGFFVDGGYPKQEFRYLSRTLEILEQSCSPNHGSVLSHSIKDGSPILKPDQIPTSQRADIQDIQDGILNFNKIYISHIPKNTSVRDLYFLAEIIRPILTRAMLSPSREEAKIFSEWLHDDNLASGSASPIMGDIITNSFSRYKTAAQYIETPMSDLYWPSGALAIYAPDRLKTLSLAIEKNIDPAELDTKLSISSELASSFSSSEKDTDHFINKQNIAVWKNPLGLSYLSFELPADENSIIRWMPSNTPFEIKIDFLIFTFTENSGRETKTKVSTSSQFNKISQTLGISGKSSNCYYGNGEGSAFYFKNMGAIGISTQGQLKLEIAARINPITDQSIEHEKSLFPLTSTSTAGCKPGYGAIDTFNHEEVQDDLSFHTPNGTISITGWMTSPELKSMKGEFFLRVTNEIGEAIFVPAETIARPDIAEMLGEPRQLNCGYAIKNQKIPPGKYNATIIHKSESAFLVWEKAIEINSKNQ